MTSTFSLFFALSVYLAIECSSTLAGHEMTESAISNISNTTTSQPSENGSDDFSKYERIVGGTTAAKNEYPYQVKLETTVFNSDGESDISGCGGVIIHQRFILTAAHCVFNPFYEMEPGICVAAKDINVYAGVVDLKKKGLPLKVNSYIVHPKYRYGVQLKDYDLAILELCSPLKWSMAVGKIELVDPCDQVERKVIATGFGYTSKSSRPLERPSGSFSDLLQEVELDLLSSAECQAKYVEYKGEGASVLNYAKVTPRYICVIGKDKGPCVGDSGNFVYFVHFNTSP